MAADNTSVGLDADASGNKDTNAEDSKPVEDHHQIIDATAQFLKEKISKNPNASVADSVISEYAQEIYKDISSGKADRLSVTASRLVEKFSDGFNSDSEDFFDPISAQKIVTDTINFMATQLHMAVPDYRFKALAPLSAHSDHANANSTRQIELLNRTDFIERLKTDDAFSELNLDQHTVNQGKMLLRAIYEELPLNGIEEFIHASVHPNPGTGFHTQTLRVKPLSHALTRVVKDVTQSINDANETRFLENQLSRIGTDSEIDDSSTPKKSFLHQVLEHEFKVPVRMSLDSSRISEVALMSSACKLLETYLEHETKIAKIHPRVNSSNTNHSEHSRQ